jgi:hypothetical protein
LRARHYREVSQLEESGSPQKMHSPRRRFFPVESRFEAKNRPYNDSSAAMWMEFDLIAARSDLRQVRNMQASSARASAYRRALRSSLTISHGLPLNEADVLKCARTFKELGMTYNDLAVALRIPVGRLHTFMLLRGSKAEVQVFCS